MKHLAPFFAALALLAVAAVGAQTPRPTPTVPHMVYVAEIVRVVDGDTVDVDIALGFNIHTQIRIRVAHIDAPEMRGPERPDGIRATEYARTFLGQHAILVPPDSRGFRRGRYGRWIADLEVNGHLLSREMLSSGNAERYPPVRP